MRTLTQDQRVRHRFVLLSYPVTLVSEEDVKQKLLPKKCDKILLGPSRSTPVVVNVLCLHLPAFDNRVEYFSINGVYPSIRVPDSDQDVLICIREWSDNNETYHCESVITEHDVKRAVCVWLQAKCVRFKLTQMYRSNAKEQSFTDQDQTSARNHYSQTGQPSSSQSDETR
jgi:hypothetical protein